ncbi:MAG TPA: alpha-amylase family glycosyl hydrolase [Puia sp.]|nr:alpha-amylase family glycosyl hydrolase [Puia sp.]
MSTETSTTEMEGMEGFASSITSSGGTSPRLFHPAGSPALPIHSADSPALPLHSPDSPPSLFRTAGTPHPPTANRPAIPSLTDPAIGDAIRNARVSSQAGATKTISVNGSLKTFPFPFPSPTDWRDTWIYCLMIDRFNNPDLPPASTTANPASAWNQRYNFRQGGTFKGVEAALDYIAGLGARAIWITPVLKNPLPDSAPDWPYNYHGYATQDFLTIDGRFASDGTAATAATELTSLVEAAHARGLYVILDIVINHTAEVFKYVYQDRVIDSFADAGVLNGPPGNEPAIQWIDRTGAARPDWQDGLPADITGDDAVWPLDVQAHTDFFRRRGSFLSTEPPPGGFIKGDFGSLRQLVAEYEATTDQKGIRDAYGLNPVLDILIRIYSYLIAAFDIDAFRIDTVMYVDPGMVQTFGNAIREFALGIGKRNFFMFGEIDDSSYNVIDRFVGRNSSDRSGRGLGIDAALDYPLYDQLPSVIRQFSDPALIRQLFEARIDAEEDLITSHGEAGKYFVSFLDNHDQNQRFNTPGTPAAQVLMGLAVLFSLPGIPCLYYGTEQGLTGAINPDGTWDRTAAPECVREALWGKGPAAFDPTNLLYVQISALAHLRRAEPALQFGRIYFREVSGNGRDFGHSSGIGGILAFSRILYDREVLVVANTSTATLFDGYVLVDIDINRSLPAMTISYSSTGATGISNIRLIGAANFFSGATLTGSADTAALPVHLEPMEIRIFSPVAL